MPAGKFPARAIDGPFAGYDTVDETFLMVLANAAIVRVGQPVGFDLTNGGPNANVVAQAQNNTNILPSSETLLAVTSTNASAVVGVISGAPYGQPGLTVSADASGFQQIKNTSGVSGTFKITVRTQGFAMVYASALVAGTSVKVGDFLIVNTSQAQAISGAAALNVTLGQVIGTPIQTSITAATASGSQTVTPLAMTGITTTQPLVIDTVASGVQETVTPTAVSAGITTFTATFANAHGANTPVYGLSLTKANVLLAVPTGAAITGLVACILNPR